MEENPLAPAIWPQSIRHAGSSIPHQAVCAISIQASEAMLNAETVVVFVPQTQVIGVNKSALGQGIFCLHHALCVFLVFLDHILIVNFTLALALQFNCQRNIIKFNRATNTETGQFNITPARKWRSKLCITGIIISSRQGKHTKIIFSTQGIISLGILNLVVCNTRRKRAIFISQIQVIFGLVAVIAFSDKSDFGTESAQYGCFIAKLTIRARPTSRSSITLQRWRIASIAHNSPFRYCVIAGCFRTSHLELPKTAFQPQMGGAAIGFIPLP